MPSTDEHLSKAQHNEVFAASFDIDRTPFADWVVVGCFYSAMHLVDAYLATVNMHPRNHAERTGLVRRLPDLRAIQLDYRMLLDDSIEARYGVVRFSAANVRQEVIPKLAGIKTHILSLMP